MSSKGKIQHLLIDYLLKHGQIELLLPDGVVLEIGVTQEDATTGGFIVKDDYCWVIATHKDRSAALDPYNLGLRFSGDGKNQVAEDKFIDQDGTEVTRVDVF
jgi:hypothetical protein